MENSSDKTVRDKGSGAFFRLSKKELLVVCGLLVSSLILRGVYQYFVQDHLFFLHPILEAKEYLRQAEQWRSGWTGDRILLHMPLYPFLLSVAKLLFQEPLWMVYLFQMVLGTLTSIFVFFLSRHLFNEHVGYISLILMGFHPAWILFETRPFPVVILGFLFVTGCIFLVLSERKGLLSPAFLMFSGICFALAFLTKAVTLVFVCLMGVFLLTRRDWTWFRKIISAGFWAAPTLVVLGGIIFLQYQTHRDLHGTGKVILTKRSGMELYLGNRKEAPGYPDIRTGYRHQYLLQEPVREDRIHSPASHNAYFLRKTAREIYNHPATFGRLLVKKFYYLFTSYEIPVDVPVQTLLEESQVFGTFGPYSEGTKILKIFSVPSFLANKTFRFPWIPFAVLISGGVIGGILLTVYGRGLAWSLPLLVGSQYLMLLIFSPSTKGRLSVLPVLAVLAAGGIYMIGLFLVSLDWSQLIWSVPLLFLICFLSFSRSFEIHKARNQIRTSLHKARILWEEHEPVKAISILSKAQKKRFRDWDLRYAYARYLWTFKQQYPDEFSRAKTEQKSVFRTPEIVIRNLVQEISNQNVPIGAVYGLLGRVLLKQDNLEEAKQYFRKATSTNPEARWWVGLGKAHLRSSDSQKKARKTVSVMETALKAAPQCLECEMIKANAQALQKKMESSEAIFQQLKKRLRTRETSSSLFAKLYYYWGRSLELQKKDRTKAREYYQKSVRYGGGFGTKSERRLQALSKQEK